MLATVSFLFVLGVLVLAHEFGHFIVAKFFKVRVEIFSIGFGRKILGIKKGDTEYRISLFPLGGYVKMAGDNPEEVRKGDKGEFLSKSPGERSAIVLAGPAFNYLISFLIFSFIFFTGFPRLITQLGEVKENYPAYEAGIKTGDRIVSIDGKEVEFWDDLSLIIHDKVENIPVKLRVERDEQVLEITVIPKVESVKNIFGEEQKIGLSGVAPSDESKIVRFPPLESIYYGAEQVVSLTKLTYFSFYNMIIGKMSVRNSLAGPVEIFRITGKEAEKGFVNLLHLMAVLSVSLAIINLFPVPVLDGGHLLFFLFEKIRGKPVGIKGQEVATRIGFSILIGLMVFVLYNDLSRIGFFEKVFNLFSSK
ncbi:MAG: RIP metalloprotease RseP [Candidatus Omnitrophica bacterium]|nr:RIP metalloprotease RseP [Candidatus Omnitrophota bacterium]